jgi:hypothetical protein
VDPHPPVNLATTLETRNHLSLSLTSFIHISQFMLSWKSHRGLLPDVPNEARVAEKIWPRYFLKRLGKDFRTLLICSKQANRKHISGWRRREITGGATPRLSPLVSHWPRTCGCAACTVTWGLQLGRGQRIHYDTSLELSINGGAWSKPSKR